MIMLNKTGEKQIKMVCLTIEDLMPEDHFLRDLDKLVSFDFIYRTFHHL